MNNIALICDDNYCLPTAVCIQSILDHLASANFTIHVCTFGLTVENQRMLLNLSCKKSKIIIEVFQKENYSDLLSQVSPKTHVSTAALIKFELANYFKDLERILYLDSDIIIKNDISAIFETDLSESYLAASFEFWDFLNYHNYSFKKDYQVDFHFNSGAMLFNLEKMRSDNISEKLWDYKINHSKSPRMDQESFNAVCGPFTSHLSIKWNFNPAFASEKNIIHINNIYQEQYTSLDDLLEDVCIIHYVGEKDKPWEYATAPMRAYWDEAYKRANLNIPLNQKTYVPQPSLKKLMRLLANAKKQHGIKGAFCYVVNLVLKR